jgi:hypothetical protein
MTGKTSVLIVLALALAVPAAARPPRDGIDLSKVHVYDSPADVASWPITTAITQLNMRPNGDPQPGVSLTFSALQTWPDYTPPGWDGPLQYTVWAVWYAAGQWNAAGIIQMWRGRGSTGAPLLESDPGCNGVDNFACNWIYSTRWGPGAGHQVVAGEQIGFFVTAGNARDTTTVTSVRERSNVVMISLPANDYGSFTFPAQGLTTLIDYDGDGISDAVLFRPSNGTWYIGQSSTQSGISIPWGNGQDIPVAGDYDGDGRTDIAVFRPSNGTWYIRYSATGQTTAFQWGNGQDIPVPADYDGDGRTDIAVFRPSNGVWYIWLSSTQSSTSAQWASTGDIPVPADYDGDGKADLAVFRPSNGVWYIRTSSTLTLATVGWGNGGDIPVPADYDGDGKTDVAIFRPSTGTWHIYFVGTGLMTAIQWGNGKDIPVPGDYDGDGKFDVAVFRPSTGTWYGWLSRSQTMGSIVWGLSGDLPIK